MNIFIFGSSYTTRTLLLNIDLLLEISINRIYVLGENHKLGEFEKIDYDIEIVDNVDKGISNSDLIIMMCERNIPTQSIDYVKNKSAELRKKYFDINIDGINRCQNSIQSINCCPEKSLPSVLIISIGAYSQMFITEIAVHDILETYGVRYCQNFTERTSNIISQFNKYGKIKISYEKHIKNIIHDPQILIRAIDVNDINDDALNSALINIEGSSYNCVILQTEQMRDYENVIAYVEARIFRKIDLLIHSNYFSYEGSAVYCGSSGNQNNYSLEDKSLKSILTDTIFSKLAFPEGMHCL